MVKAVVETSKIRKTEKKVAPALVSALKRKNSRIKGRSISGLNDQVYLPLKVFKKQSNQKIGMKEVISSNPPQLILSQKSKFTFLVS